jgi:hypothetical protein
LLGILYRFFNVVNGAEEFVAGFGGLAGKVEFVPGAAKAYFLRPESAHDAAKDGRINRAQFRIFSYALRGISHRVFLTLYS